MAYPKKTFGQHLEDGLTFMGDGIYNAVKESKDHELQTIKLGFISDEEKLKMLKRQLYQSAMGRGDSEYITNLRSVITTLSNQLENERNYQNTLSYHIYGILNSAILLAILAASLSFPMAWGCGVAKNQSQACQVSRVIPYSVIKFFSEPK
ncbi:MAG: hypothetical protein PUP93_21265 [Rhizonema sp. NSF051]|nr:hypothetical protein [Rhizonema sp. NSF051]